MTQERRADMMTKAGAGVMHVEAGRRGHAPRNAGGH